MTAARRVIPTYLVGRAAVAEQLENPSREKVTLVWDDDVLGLFATLFEPGPTAKYFDLSEPYRSVFHYDAVLMTANRWASRSTSVTPTTSGRCCRWPSSTGNSANPAPRSRSSGACRATSRRTRGSSHTYRPRSELPSPRTHTSTSRARVRYRSWGRIQRTISTNNTSRLGAYSFGDRRNNPLALERIGPRNPDIHYRRRSATASPTTLPAQPSPIHALDRPPTNPRCGRSA